VLTEPILSQSTRLCQLPSSCLQVVSRGKFLVMFTLRHGCEMILTCLLFIICFLIRGVINVFLNDFLSEDRGLSVQLATATLMCFSLGHAFGIFLLGGALARALYAKDKRYPSILAGFMALGGCVPLWLLLNFVDASTAYWKVALVACLAGFGSGPTGPIIKATMTNVTLPRARGQAFALFNLFDDFGKGLGPYFVSILITQMGGRLPAFNIGIFGWVVCGIANLAIFFTVEQDEATTQAVVAAQPLQRY
jgi:MFS-type transporter involved in bile tolerance (Atg22 family)